MRQLYGELYKFQQYQQPLLFTTATNYLLYYIYNTTTFQKVFHLLIRVIVYKQIKINKKRKGIYVMNEKELVQALKEAISPLFDRLDNMETRFDEMETKFEERFDGIDNRLDGIDERLYNVEREVVKTNIRIENEVIPRIQSVQDRFIHFPEKIKEQEERIDEIDSDVITLKVAVFGHQLINK